ncbi:Ras-related protein Rab-22A [Histomonas meleagridis]|uniref:Ras-related protein Rab-22A n=1 Tax=Histomonas meleagridis TaxID=135588 RepID=UPI00355AA655|nr:Ras-related protein Rab-22A [Histomonas meleagridis]KAH0799706.1 Ras-related protein Rab-22A [Histomonas meleagridis]
MESKSNVIKIVLLGDAGTGKSSLLTRWADDRYDPSLKSTIGVAFRNVSFEFQSEQHEIQIWDTAGQETFRSTSPLYCRNAYSAMIVYDITSKSSFNSLEEWIQILRSDGNEIPFVLVGNKSDLAASRDVPFDLGKQFAKNYNTEFYETSVVRGEFVNEAFEAVVTRAIMQKKRNDPLIEGVTQIDLSQQTGGQKKDCC